MEPSQQSKIILPTPQFIKPQPVKDRRLRFLLNSNAAWTNSGYAVEARDLMKRFIADGWPAGMIGFSGHEGAPISFDGYTVYGRMADIWGSDALYHHGKHYGAQVLLCFHDAWVLNPQFLQQINQEGGKIVFYVPIDMDPIPPNVLSNLRFAYRIVTFSKWGQKTLQKHGYTSTYIPEGVDINIFKPQDKLEYRKFFNIAPSTFVIGMVGANKENLPRKGWQQALEAFKMFHDKHEDSIFWFECNQETGGGFPIRQYAEYLGIGKSIMSLDPYMSTFHADSIIMSKMYSMFDVLTHCSLTEGFGLCMYEALACGIPLVVNDYSAMPEAVIPGKTGYICKPGFKWFTNALSWNIVPDPQSMYECYEQIYADNRIEMGKAARKFITEGFDIDKIYEHKWKPFLIQLQDEILGKLDVPPQTK